MERVLLIRLAQALGFSLREIVSFLALHDESPAVASLRVLGTLRSRPYEVPPPQRIPGNSPSGFSESAAASGVSIAGWERKAAHRLST